MNNLEKIIETKNLTKIYKMGEYNVEAVFDVNLTINSGDFISIIGPSGSGKTTLLNLISFIDKPSQGYILFEGKDVTKLKEDELDIIRLKKIGFVFQSFNLLPTLSAIENVELPLEFARAKKDDRRKRAKQVLELVGLEKRISHRPYQLSAGEQQRVGIARALANNPTIILADEPTGNLDSKTAKEIVNLFSKLNQEGQTIVIVTHAHYVKDVTKKVFEMRDGKINVDLYK